MTQMLCTACNETAEPDTLIEGSDLVEMLSWLCLAVPGWLYCWWRHSLRLKVCAHCGSESLIREARAAKTRRLRTEPRAGQRVRNTHGPERWPRALATPRDRLRHGGVGALLVAGLVSFGMLNAIPQPPGNAVGAALSFGTLTAIWLIVEAVRIARLQPSSCAAWDASGRALAIKWLD
jgi:hypothetical protein